MTSRLICRAMPLVLLALAFAASMTASAPHRAAAGELCPSPFAQGNSYTLFPPEPVVIPDNDMGGVIVCMSINDGRTIDDLDVGLNVIHRWPGDLVFTLSHQNTGTTVTLVDRPGVPADGIGCGLDGDDMVVVLDDEAADPVEDECADATPTIAGTFRPNQALSAFDGESLSGTWILFMRDAAVGDVGALHAWSLILSSSSGAVGDVDCSGTVNSIDAALTLQLVAGVVGALPCEDAADTNVSGSVNSIDVALILQFTAGLLPALPP